MRALILLPALALGLAVAACDDGDDDRRPTNDTPPAEQPRDDGDRHEN